MEDLIYKENEKVLITLNAQDDDGDKVTYSVDDSKFNKLSDNEFEWQTDYDSAGEYTFKISASDGTDTVSKEVHLKIENVNRPPQILEIIQS